MRIFSRGTLRDFWIKHPDSEQQLLTWFDIFSKTEFRSSNQIKEIFGSADYVKSGIIIFNICGNKYRLIAKFNYSKHLIFILFIGTHKQYDKINVEDFIN